MLREDNDGGMQQIWEGYLLYLAFAIRNLNLVIDGPIIISGYLAPYFTEEDLEYLLERINSSTPFKLERRHLIVGMQGQYTPAVGSALYYVEQFLESIS